MTDLFPSTLRPPTPIQIHQIGIEFDGGNGCNIPARGYGDGYGSYQISWNGHKQEVVKLKYGRPMSNNVAEMSILISAITWVQKIYIPERIECSIYGDSQLALARCLKLPKSKCKPGSEDYHATAARLFSLCQSFRSVQTHWRGREASVKLFGH